MPQTIHTLLIQYLSEIKKIYGAHLKSVILYGSYARGDYTPDSDIDIMILVDLSVEEMDAYSDALSELGFKYNVQHDIWMMPVVKNQQHFYHWAASYPFYSNVQKEGVVLYEAAWLRWCGNWQRNIYLQNQRAHLKIKILINQCSNNSQSKC